ncbi:hypothetical protein [Bradyrhizobium sp.]|jgi:hypothetical protein|uniref:hypothetical protein n=1 Tax=Bradyrhizobium sp. TaxID=376 RepID=UPI003C20A778
MPKAFITATVAGLMLATMLPASNAVGIGPQASPIPGATAGTTTGVGNPSNGAGSVAAAADSAANPSGNTFINTSPSGSTLMPNTGGAAGGGRRR